MPLSHREREGPAAKRWEGERFHRQPENPDSFRCAVSQANPSCRHGRDRQRPPPSPEPDLGRESPLEARPQPPGGGFRFLRQVPIDRYFADFVCEAGKLIVELDGATHEGREDYDENRTRTLELFGYVVLRFPNERVLADPDAVIDDILTALRSVRV
jgi:hypothetical protein